MINPGFTIAIHAEYWDDRDGRTVILEQCKAAAGSIVPGTVHVLTPSSLTAVGSEWGECEIWYTVQTSAGVAMYDVVTAMRTAARVKTAGVIPSGLARADYAAVLAHLYADDGDE